MTSTPTKRSASPPSGTAVAAAAAGPAAGAAAIQEQRPPPLARPPPRSNFDLEPNPFEHSFSSTSVGSDSKANPNAAQQQQDPQPNAGNGNDDESKPVLPPLSSIVSPTDNAFSTWALSSSLRSGPLSPAMLAGPANQQTPSLGLGAFDSSFVRTGLTPDVSRTGLTPLIGGGSVNGFPPPSPNTAALFALVNGTSAGAPLGSNIAITPNTLNAITGVLNQSMNPIGGTGPTSVSLDGPQQQHMSVSFDHDPAGNYQDSQQARGSYDQQPGAYANNESASHAITNAASALYLLSQQNLQRQNQGQGQVAPSAISGGPPPPAPQRQVSPNSVSPTTRRATKRKSMDTSSSAAGGSATGAAPAARGNKKAKTTANGRAAKRRNSKPEEEEDEDDFDDDDDDIYEEGMGQSLGMTGRTTSSSSARGNKKPETEEEKRKNFLERNRQAALKCRQRKKAWLQALQAKVEFLQSENDRLTSALVGSREEIARLSAAVLAQGGNPNGPKSDQMQGVVETGDSPATMPKVLNGQSSSTNPNNAPGTTPMATGIGHSHGHHRVPPAQNGVTVGGRSYGY